jgi:hypothetical protein
MLILVGLSRGCTDVFEPHNKTIIDIQSNVHELCQHTEHIESMHDHCVNTTLLNFVDFPCSENGFMQLIQFKYSLITFNNELCMMLQTQNLDLFSVLSKYCYHVETIRFNKRSEDAYEITPIGIAMLVFGCLMFVTLIVIIAKLNYSYSRVNRSVQVGVFAIHPNTSVTPFTPTAAQIVLNPEIGKRIKLYRSRLQEIALIVNRQPNLAPKYQQEQQLLINELAQMQRQLANALSN